MLDQKIYLKNALEAGCFKVAEVIMEKYNIFPTQRNIDSLMSVGGSLDFLKSIKSLNNGQCPTKFLMAQSNEKSIVDNLRWIDEIDQGDGENPGFIQRNHRSIASTAFFRGDLRALEFLQDRGLLHKSLFPLPVEGKHRSLSRTGCHQKNPAHLSTSLSSS